MALIISLLGHGFLLLVGTLSRPLLIWVLKMRIKFSDVKHGEQESVRCTPTRLMLFYNQKSPWQNVSPVLKLVSTVKMQIFISNSFCCLYLANGRLDEAQEAARFWYRVSDDWVRTHLVEAEESLHLWNKLYTWSLFPKVRDTEISESEAMKIMNKIVQIEGGKVKEWRNARVAVELLTRLSQDGEEAAAVLVEHLNIKKNPITFQHIVFDSEAADIMGISEQEFKQICLRAETL